MNVQDVVGLVEEWRATAAKYLESAERLGEERGQWWLGAHEVYSHCADYLEHALRSDEFARLREDAEKWNRHKDSFAVLESVLDVASPLVLNKLKAKDAAIDAARTPEIAK